MEANNSKGESVRSIERLLLEPWQSVFRVAYGFFVALLIVHWRGRDISMWEWILLFLGALILLRLAPIIARKALPFSKAVKAVWFEQRQLAKRFDSFQWAKLLWLGIGVGAHVIYAGRLMAQEGMLALACIVAGGLGAVMWWRAQATIRKTISAANA